MFETPTGLVAGTDEAGRGPLVGSVVAAAVILDPANPIEGLNDSKKLSAKRREALYEQIVDKALAWHISEASAAEIDEINILWASMLAMKRAVEGLSTTPELVLVDGNRCPDLQVPSRAIVGGDGIEECIGAASILAKVYRDRQMEALHLEHPGYGFDKHKGYPTKVHMQALNELGAIDQHRRSFAPVKKLLFREV